MEAQLTPAPTTKKSPEPTKQLKPASAKDIRERAMRWHHNGEIAKAVGAYKTYLRMHPNDASVWSNLGAALRKQKRYQLAVSCYQRGLSLNPTDLGLKSNLANVLKDLHQYDEAITLHQQVIAKRPDDSGALMNFACALREAGQFKEALTILDKAKTLAPNNPHIEWERAQNLLYIGDYKNGWIAYESRWLTGDLPDRSFPCPQWQGEDINNKTILIHAEQGYGDTILAARFIPMVKAKGATVLLSCKTELHRLFAELGADELIAPEQTPKDMDYHIPMMSLMGMFDINENNVPPPAKLTYPQSCKDKFVFLERENKGKLKVGIVWSGSVTFANNDNRSMGLEEMLPLSQLENVQLYSFQKGPRAKELYDTGADCVIKDLGRMLEDFADTAAAVDQMDVIVMTDSSLAHLAGSMGKPVINMLEPVPYWLYTVAESNTPWHKNMILFRQKKSGEWDQVIQKVKEQLNKLVSRPQGNEIKTELLKT